MITSMKAFNAALSSIKTKSGSLRTQAIEAAQFVIDNGNGTETIKASGHYDLAVNLLNALSFNKTLQDDVLSMFVGVIPHALPCTNGVYRLGKKDLDLLVSSEKYEQNQQAKLAKKAATAEKIAKANAEKALKLNTYDTLVKQNAELSSKVNIDQESIIKDLQQSKQQAIAEAESLELQVNRLSADNDRLSVDNAKYQAITEAFNNLKAAHELQAKELVQANKTIATLQAAIVNTTTKTRVKAA
jgi:hypothetical protein